MKNLIYAVSFLLALLIGCSDDNTVNNNNQSQNLGSVNYYQTYDSGEEILVSFNVVPSDTTRTPFHYLPNFSSQYGNMTGFKLSGHGEGNGFWVGVSSGSVTVYFGKIIGDSIQIHDTLGVHTEPLPLITPTTFSDTTNDYYFITTP